MSATTVAGPVDTHESWGHGVRLALVAAAVVVLLALSFAVGRATVSTARTAPAIAPTAAPTSFGQPTTEPCRMGRAC